jgi:hypothetical protein
MASQHTPPPPVSFLMADALKASLMGKGAVDMEDSACVRP